MNVLYNRHNIWTYNNYKFIWELRRKRARRVEEEMGKNNGKGVLLVWK